MKRGVERSETRIDLPLDGELMKRVRNGDVGAFERIVHIHWDDLIGYAEALLPDSDAAHDVVQTTFTRVWERRAEWNDDKPVRTYLFRAVRNRIIDEQRRVRVWERWSTRFMLEFRRVVLTPDRIAEQTELAETLERAIQSLPERRREVFVLAHFQNFTYKEIADLLKLAPQTVANHMSLALRDLRKMLGSLIAADGADAAE